MSNDRGGRLVLASASASRAHLLARAGISVIVDPAVLDEDEIKASFRGPGNDAGSCAMALAEAKAAQVARRHPGVLVIGADQMLECDGAWYDKPRDRGEARAQLLALRGRRHELVSAICVTCDGMMLWHAIERPRLAMRAFSDTFLDDYLAAMGDNVLRTVGGYELEGLGAQLFARIEGDYFAILGLPLLPLLDFLRGQGVITR